VAEEMKADARRRLAAEVVARIDGTGDTPPGAVPSPA
jgi:hypothetical protein